jgi:tetratricopeptide (TPR) repeat protein
MECLRHNVTALVGDWQHERFGTPGVVSVMSRARFSSCAAELGAFAEGAAMAEEAVRIAEAVDHPFSLTQACFGFGDLHAQRGDLPVAIRALERGLHLCRVANIHTWSPTVAAALGPAYALSGRVAEALPLLQEAVERADAMGVSAGQSRRLVSLSTACLLGGRVAEAAALADRALEVARDLGARGYEAHALCHLGDVHVRRNGLDVEAAEAAYQQALGLAGQLGMRPLQARCHLGLGIVYRRTGRGDQARDALAGAVGLFREMAMRFWLPRAEDELAQARAPA